MFHIQFCKQDNFSFLPCFLLLFRVCSYTLNLLVRVICVLQRPLPRKVPPQLVVPFLLLCGRSLKHVCAIFLSCQEPYNLFLFLQASMASGVLYWSTTGELK